MILKRNEAVKPFPSTASSSASTCPLQKYQQLWAFNIVDIIYIVTIDSRCPSLLIWMFCVHFKNLSEQCPAAVFGI